MSRDRYERRHRQTLRHPAGIALVASADFNAAPPLVEAMGLTIPAKHTPGEWTLDGDYIRTENEEGEEITICRVGTVDSVHFPPPDEEVRGNTALLLASPDLLAACKMFLDKGDVAARKAIRRAVTKATTRIA